MENNYSQIMRGLHETLVGVLSLTHLEPGEQARTQAALAKLTFAQVLSGAEAVDGDEFDLVEAIEPALAKASAAVFAALSSVST